MFFSGVVVVLHRVTPRILLLLFSGSYFVGTLCFRLLVVLYGLTFQDSSLVISRITQANSRDSFSGSHYEG